MRVLVLEHFVQLYAGWNDRGIVRAHSRQEVADELSVKAELRHGVRQNVDMRRNAFLKSPDVGQLLHCRAEILQVNEQVNSA